MFSLEQTPEWTLELSHQRALVMGVQASDKMLGDNEMKWLQYERDLKVQTSYIS